MKLKSNNTGRWYFEQPAYEDSRRVDKEIDRTFQSCEGDEGQNDEPHHKHCHLDVQIWQ